MLKVKNTQRGFAALFIAIIVLVVVFGIVISIAAITLGEEKISRNVTASNQAYYSAESGIEDAVYRIIRIKNISSNYTMPVGRGTVNILINSPNQNNRIITALSDVNNVSRGVEASLNIETTNPQFFYGIQAGDMGIKMDNNSRIEGMGGTPGNVYSNGTINGDNNATITGTAFVATGMSEDEKHTIYNSDQIFGQAIPVIDIAQSFEPNISNTLPKISIYIKKVGSPGDQIVRILTDSAGSPSKTSLASGILQGNLVGTSYGWVDVVFLSPPNLTKNTTYWLMIDISKDNKNYWTWGKDQNQGYGNGQAKYTDDWSKASPAWALIAGDLNFKTFMGGQATFLDSVTVLGDAHANTITNSNICGDAYYQTIDSSSLNFLNNPGGSCLSPLTFGAAYPGSTDPPLGDMPISESNINEWKDGATDGGVYPGNLTVDSDMSLGPQKIDGNLIFSKNDKTLTVTGTIYVTGYIDFSATGVKIRCSVSYGLNSCVVIADKWIGIKNNAEFYGSGQPESYIMLLTTSNCDGSSPTDCSTGNSAIYIKNNATGAIFYAHNGLVYAENGIEVTELTGRKIHLSQTATVKYEQGLISVGFSSGPGGGWHINSWKEIE